MSNLMHPTFNTTQFPFFVCSHGNWDIYTNASGYCASIPTAEARANGCKASHFGDSGYVRVTLGVDVGAAIAAHAVKAPAMVPQPVQQAQAQDTRAASPILQRLAEEQKKLADARPWCDDPEASRRIAAVRTWRSIFNECERLTMMAVASDPVAYVRAYPSHAFAYRHLLPADMVARIEAAETDADMVEAVREPAPVEPESDGDADPATLDFAREQYRESPNAINATVYLETAVEYAADGIIEDDTLRAIEVEVSAWNTSAPICDHLDGTAPDMVPQPVQQVQAHDRRRPPAFLVRREERKAARRVYRPRAAAPAPVSQMQRQWAAPVIRERIAK